MLLNKFTQRRPDKDPEIKIRVTHIMKAGMNLRRTDQLGPSLSYRVISERVTKWGYIMTGLRKNDRQTR
jgi:hypothetical protein